MVHTAKIDKATVLLDQDLGDTSIVVKAYADGMFLVEVGEARVLLSAEQFATLENAFLDMADRRHDR